MKKIVFWIGVGILVVGVILFGYGYVTIQNLIEKFREYAEHPFTPFPWLSSPSGIEQQLGLAQLLQLIGLGMLVLGAIMIAYGILVKK